MMRGSQFAPLAIWGFVIALSATNGALAEDYSWCRNGGFPDEQEGKFGLARMVAKGRTHFRGDVPGCPDKSERCLSRSYVITGDVVLTGRAQGDFVCAYFPNEVGGSAGWLPKVALSPLRTDANPRLESWVGKWFQGDDQIVIRKVASKLSASGEAYWPSANPPLDVMLGGPHLGWLSATTNPKRDVAIFEEGADEYSCRVELHLVGRFLVANDNSNCGGMNVRFMGVFRRR